MCQSTHLSLSSFVMSSRTSPRNINSSLMLDVRYNCWHTPLVDGTRHFASECPNARREKPQDFPYLQQVRDLIVATRLRHRTSSSPFPSPRHNKISYTPSPSRYARPTPISPSRFVCSAKPTWSCRRNIRTEVCSRTFR